MSDNLKMSDVQIQRDISKRAMKLSVEKNMHIDTAIEIVKKQNEGRGIEDKLSAMSTYAANNHMEAEQLKDMLLEMIKVCEMLNYTVHFK